MQKKLVLVCDGSLCPRKLPDVSGPGLEEAGRYRMISEPTLAVSTYGMWPREDVPGLGLTDEDVGLLRG